MPLNTRAKKRESVQAFAEYAIHNQTAKSIKLNIPRHSIEAEVSEVVFLKSSLIDISVIGCAIDSQYLIPPGVVLDIKIDSKPFVAETGGEGKDPIHVIGKVTSCVMKSTGHYRLGVFFTNIDKKDIGLIDSFIASKERRKAPRWGMDK